MNRRIIQFGEGGQPTGQILEFGDSQLGALRIADPVLTTLAQGYRNEMMIWDTLFPTIPVSKESGKFPAFGQEAFLSYDTKRGLRQEVKKMEVKTGSVQLTLSEHALGFAIDKREEQEFAGTPEQLKTIRQMMVTDALDLEREIASATLALTNANYASANKKTGVTTWATTAGDPISDIIIGREAIRGQIGRYPNVAVFDPKAWRLFITSPTVRDYMKTRFQSNAGLLVTPELVAQVIEVQKVVIGRAVSGSGSSGGVGETALTMADVWSAPQAGNVVLAWVGNGFGVPGYGYTYSKLNYPQTTSYYWEPIKSTIYDEERIYDCAITLAKAGYLIYSIT